jgi:hypothetical protein
MSKYGHFHNDWKESFERPRPTVPYDPYRLRESRPTVPTTPESPLSEEGGALPPDWIFVTRKQASGRTNACVSCNRVLGGTHAILCYELHLAREAADHG